MAPLLAPAQAEPTGAAAQTCERLLTELSESNRAIFHRHPSLRDKVRVPHMVMLHAHTSVTRMLCSSARAFSPCVSLACTAAGAHAAAGGGLGGAACAA
jgi:hypothetical protein